MSEWKKPDRILELEEWARGMDRVTVFYIMNKFEVDRDLAQDYYDYLKGIGIVGAMGYVNKEQ